MLHDGWWSNYWYCMCCSVLFKKHCTYSRKLTPIWNNWYSCIQMYGFCNLWIPKSPIPRPTLISWYYFYNYVLDSISPLILGQQLWCFLRHHSNPLKRDLWWRRRRRRSKERETQKEREIVCLCVCARACMHCGSGSYIVYLWLCNLWNSGLCWNPEDWASYSYSARLFFSVT